jgi:hypothetical protein
MIEQVLDVGAARVTETAKETHQLDGVETVAWESEIAICLLANFDFTEVALVDLTEALPPSETLNGFVARRLHWVGILGLCDGCPRVALIVAPEESAIALMAGAFLAHMHSGGVKTKAKRDIGFMERMYQLRRRLLEKN